MYMFNAETTCTTVESESGTQLLLLKLAWNRYPRVPYLCKDHENKRQVKLQRSTSFRPYLFRLFVLSGGKLTELNWTDDENEIWGLTYETAEN